MLVCDPTDRTPKPEVIDFAARLENLHTRTVGQVATLAGEDAGVPMLPTMTAELAAAERRYMTTYNGERAEVARHVAMLAADEQRTADHEAAVRAALQAGEAPPTPADPALVKKILAESKQARIDAWPGVEDAARTHVAAAKLARESRALLLVERLRPSVESAAATIREFEAADAAAGMTLDRAATIAQFKAEGLLL